MMRKRFINDSGNYRDTSGPVHFGNDVNEPFSSSTNMTTNNSSGLSFVWRDDAVGATTKMPSFDGGNSMMWTNPYPKKKAEPDNGTAVWGDPNRQGPIQRWQPGGPATMPVQSSANTGALLATNENRPTGDHWISSGAENSGSIGCGSLWGEERSTPTPKADSSVFSWSNEGMEKTTNSSIESAWPIGKFETKTGWDLGDGDKKSTTTVLDPVPSNFSSNLPFSSGRVHPHSVLTRQIADQLKRIVHRGLLDRAVLQKNFGPEQLDIMNQFLHYVSKLEIAQSVYSQFKSSAALFTSYDLQQQMQQLANEIRQLFATITTLRHKLEGQVDTQRGESINPMATNGHSKLEQWRQGTQSPISFSDGPSMPEQSFGYRSGATWSDLNGDSNSSWPTIDNDLVRDESQIDSAKDFSDAMDDAAVNALVDSVTEDPSDDIRYRNSTSTPIQDDTGSGTGSGSGRDSVVTPLGNTFDANVPEFVPGQPWMWKDPKELAADPDVTPSSLLSKKAALTNSCKSDAAGSKHSFPMSGLNGASGNNGIHETGRHGCLDSLPNGYVPSTTRALPWIRQGPPYSSPVPPTTVVASPFQLSHSHAGLSTPRVPYATMKLGIPAAMTPYSILAYNQSVFPLQWVVLSNLNAIDDRTLQMILSSIAPLGSCINMPGAGFAAVKFKDVSLEKILPRLHSELSALGIIVRLAKDEEVTLLLQSVNGP